MFELQLALIISISIFCFYSQIKMFQRNSFTEPHLGLLYQQINLIRLLILANLALQYWSQIDGFIISVIILSYSVSKAFGRLHQGFLTSQLRNTKFQNVDKFEQHIVNYIYMFSASVHKKKNRIQLNGALKFHSELCSSEHCKLKQIDCFFEGSNNQL